MKRFLACLGALGAATITGLATPLDRHDVPVNPVLLAHVDLDALNSTAVGKAILADTDVQTKLAGVQAAFNFDLQKQLHGFTVYTTSDQADDALLIIYADFDSDRLLTMAKAFPGFHAQTNGSHAVYNWIDEKKKTDDTTPRIYASLAGHRVVFGRKQSSIEGALEVIDGKQPGLAKEYSLLSAASGETVVAEAVALKLNVNGNDAHAEIFKASKAVRALLGEDGNNVDLKVQFDAKDEDSANQITAMVNGMLALLQFQKDNPELIKIANGIKVKQDGMSVTLDATAKSADVVALLQKGAAEAREKKEQAESAPATNSADKQ